MVKNSKKYKVHYWRNGRKCVARISATSKENAKVKFYLSYLCDDIIKIEEVTD